MKGAVPIPWRVKDERNRIANHSSPFQADLAGFMAAVHYESPAPVLPPPSPSQARINLGDLKSHIVKKLGIDRAQQYFGYLNRLLSQKLSKPDFTKLLLSTIGRENIPLHNQLVRSILKNACNGKVPPPLACDKKASNHHVKDAVSAPLPPVRANGVVFPPSPCKSRSGTRTVGDHPGPFEQIGRKDGLAPRPPTPANELIAKENGELSPCDLKRPVQHHQDGSAEQPVKRRRTDKSISVDQTLSCVGSLAEVVAVGHSEDLQCRDHFESVRGPLRAPLGIPFCPPSIGGSRRPIPLNCCSSSSGGFISNYDGGALSNSEDLKRRIEKIAEGEGLAGVTMDSANLLNNALDAYLKRLISSCTELVRARSGQDPSKKLIYKHEAHSKLINGVWQRNHMQAQSNGNSMGGTKEQPNSIPITLQDFKVAMELDPQQLGEYWPLHLEKLYFHAVEE